MRMNQFRFNEKLVFHEIHKFIQLYPTVSQDTPVKCHALTFNGDLSCGNQADFNSAETNKCGEPQDIGTIAKFKCKANYVLHEANPGNSNLQGNDFMEEEMKCGENGTWIGYQRFKSYHCREVCGRRLTNPKPLIINGVATNTTSWPWHAAIFRRIGINTYYICGGSIIRRTAILTAAHCVTSAVGGHISPNTTVVVLGAVSNNFTENQLSPEVQIFNVQQIFVSESYDVKKEYQADIAVLHLDRNIEYTDYISPVCLPLPNDATIDSPNAVTLGKLADVVGFGVDESKSLSTHLKHGQLEIKSHSDCFVKMQRILTESQICAGSQRGEFWVTVCNGDSGGGLVLPSVIHEKYYIHGVVSSSENVEAGKEACQNYTVFTRVFSFISWIREVLEEISGDVDLELAATTTFPYIQSESETRRREFLPIPKDWKNKVASIELSNVDIVPEVLLKSLEYCKTARSINFTQVKFKNAFPNRKVRLPQLKNIFMDILRDDFVVSNDRTFPQDFTQDFLKSLVFFEKDINDFDVDISTIAQMKTNFEITIHIFKSLVINHEEGKIVLSQIPFTNEILAYLPKSDFQIRDLTLSRCSLSIENALLVNQTHIEKLILDQVDFRIVDLVDFLKTLNNLQEFVFVSPTNMTIDMGILPKTLKHLALTNSILNIPTVLDEGNEQFHPSAIFFPDFKPITSFRRPIVTDSEELANVETFYCDLCLPQGISLIDLSTIFPNLKQVVLKLSQTPENLNKFLKSFRYLEMAFITVAVVGSDQTISRKFATENGTLVEKQILMNGDFEHTHLDFELNRKSNFWTSEVDYIGLARSSSIERNAFNTGHYHFNGQLFPLPDGTHPPIKNPAEERFPIIPIHIQERLETIEVNNAEILRENVEESLKSCRWVKRIGMTNVSTPDPIFRNVVELPELVEYDIKTIAGLVPPLFGYKGFAAYINKVFHLFFPFKQEGFNIQELLLVSKMKLIHFQYGECVGLSWNASEGSLISASDKTNNWFKHLNSIQTNIQVKKFAYKFQELEVDALPMSITHLNLNFAIVKNVGSMLERLAGLKDLRLVNVRAQDTDIYRDWEWPKINVTDLGIHSETLKYLAIEKAHIRNFRSGISFKKLRTVYFDDLTFDSMDFADNFNTIFPNVKNLVVLGLMNSNISTSTDTILLNALKHENVKWILSKLKSIPESEKSQIRTEVEIILKNAGVNEVSKYFIIEKIHGSWVRINASLDDKQYKSQLNMIKGTSVFGTTWSCHAYTFAEGPPTNNNSP